MINGKTVVELYMSCGSLGLDDLHYPEIKTNSIPSWAASKAAKDPMAVAISMSLPVNFPAASKRKGEKLLIASHFGTASIDISSGEISKTVLFEDEEGRQFITVPARPEWTSFGSSSLNLFCATKLLDGTFIPTSMEIMKIPEGGDWSAWVDVVVPSIPSNIGATRGGGCSFISGGEHFRIDEQEKAKLILSGNVRWIVPDSNGFFVEPPMPTSPSESTWEKGMRTAIEFLKGKSHDESV